MPDHDALDDGKAEAGASVRWRTDRGIPANTLDSDSVNKHFEEADEAAP